MKNTPPLRHSFKEARGLARRFEYPHPGSDPGPKAVRATRVSAGRLPVFPLPQTLGAGRRGVETPRQ